MDDIIILLDLLTSYMSVKAIAVLSQTCRTIYERVNKLSIKNLLSLLEVRYEEKYNLKDCYELNKISSSYKQGDGDIVFKKCIKYNRDYLILDTIDIICKGHVCKYMYKRYGKDAFDIISDEEFIDIHVEAIKILWGVLRELVIKCTAKNKDITLEAFLRPKFHLIILDTDVLLNVCIFYIQRNDIIVVDKILSKSIKKFRDININDDIHLYGYCKSKEMITLLERLGIEYDYEYDTYYILENRNMFMIEFISKEGNRDQKEVLVKNMIKHHDMPSKVYKLFIDSEKGFLQYIEDEKFEYYILKERFITIENICTYGSLEDKRTILYYGLDNIEHLKFVLDMLFRYGDMRKYYAKTGRMSVKETAKLLLDKM